MSVIYVREKHAARTGGDKSDSSRSYVKVIVVGTSSADDGQVIVCLHPLVPQFGSYYATAHEADAGALLRSRRPHQTGPKTWEITCTFSTKTGDPQDREPNPLARPPKHSWSGVVYDTYPPKDLNGKPFNNSAHWRFDPAIAIPKVYGVLTIVRSEAIFNEARALEYSNVLNQDVWRGYAPTMVKLLPPRGDEQFENNISFVAVTYEFHINKETWPDVDEDVIDHGPFALKKDDDGNPTGEKLHADEAGIKHTEDLPLDGEGNVLPMAERKAGRFITIHFEKYERKSFKALGLE